MRGAVVHQGLSHLSLCCLQLIKSLLLVQVPSHVQDREADIVQHLSTEPVHESVPEDRIAPNRSSRKQAEDATRKSAASTKIQAIVRGRQVRQQKDLLQKSAITLQRALRRNGCLTGCRPDVSRLADGQRKEWAIEFERAASKGGLQKPGFLQALCRSCGAKVSQVQAEKLWAGFLEQSEAGEPMRLPTFWAICEAVLRGDAWAAEFAALAEEEYRSEEAQVPEVPACFVLLPG